ncbi:MAG: hypothetical protein M1826_006489 [Phylliscum demangeonii]|nr:MAG: hypothetical protein M1826_006489 [Phylliscum demangeonii]
MSTTFQVMRSASQAGVEHRLGQLHVRGRPSPISTPHYIGVTSRGAVPHLSPDMMRRHTQLSGVYVALEDCKPIPVSRLARAQEVVERAPRQTPPVYRLPASAAVTSPLRGFIALQDDALLVLGPRRVPAVACPAANQDAAISIYTLVGFRQLATQAYVEACGQLRPDVVVALGDYVTHQASGVRRIEKMGDRTSAWLKQMVEGMMTTDARSSADDDQPRRPAIFAPILPLPLVQQALYLEDLQEAPLFDAVSGLAIHDPTLIPDLPPALRHLPRLSLSERVESPHALLRDIHLGVDLFTLPFVNAVTDAGLALHFTFPALPASNASTPAATIPPLPLATDLWLPLHATDLSPLQAHCDCYTCCRHHRAYVHHLLTTKEMLGWVLLQVHNLAVLDRFFAGVRACLGHREADGGGDSNATTTRAPADDDGDCFARDRRRFHDAYAPDFPEQTGQGPRVRGYTFKAMGPDEVKKNAPPYRRQLDVSTEGMSALSLSSFDREAAGAAAAAMEADGARLIAAAAAATATSATGMGGDELGRVEQGAVDGC